MNRTLFWGMALAFVVSMFFGFVILEFALLFCMFLIATVESAIDYYFKKLKEHEK